MGAFGTDADFLPQTAAIAARAAGIRNEALVEDRDRQRIFEHLHRRLRAGRWERHAGHAVLGVAGADAAHEMRRFRPRPAVLRAGEAADHPFYPGFGPDPHRHTPPP